MLLRTPTSPQGLREWQDQLAAKRARILDKLAQEAVEINSARIGAIQIAMVQDLEKEITELRAI